MPDAPDYPSTLEHPDWGVATREPRLALLATEPPTDPDGGPLSTPDISDHFTAWGLEPVSPTRFARHAAGDPDARKELFNDTGRYRWVRHQHGSDDELWATVRDGIAGDPSIPHRFRFVGPVYEVPGHPGLGRYFAPLPHELVITDPSLRGLEGDALDARLAELGREINARFHRALEIDLAGSRLLARLGRYIVQSTDLESITAFELCERLVADGVAPADLHFHTVPLVKPGSAGPPDDPRYVYQWHLPAIDAEPAWVLTKGDGMLIGVIDDGYELGHEDLAPNILGSIDAAAGGGPASATTTSEWHGTEVSGIAAASLGNAIGVAGVAGRSKIFAVKFDGGAVEFLKALSLASDAGVGVLNISYNFDELATFDYEGSDLALDLVAENDILICAGTGNGDPNPHVIGYPARHPRVMAVGGSWENGKRWDGGGDESHYAPGGSPSGVSVVAPAQRTGGYGLMTTALNALGKYGRISGTSAAAPQVVGVAALLRSLYVLTAQRVQEIIEKTAEKPVGYAPWTEHPDFPNGSWNEEVGYGLLSATRAVSFADVYVKDWTGDDGSEPSAPPGGDYWSDSDVRVIANAGDVFDTGSSELTPGAENFIAVRVSNRGPATAQDVGVTCRLTKAGMGLDYPADWELVDTDHVEPELVTGPGPVAVDASGTAVFRLSAGQTATVCGWVDEGLTPTALVSVAAANDYAWQEVSFTSSPAAMWKNNLARKDLTCASGDGASTTVLAVIKLWFLILAKLLNRYPKLWIDISELGHDWPVTLELQPEGPGDHALGPVKTDVGLIKVDPVTGRRSIELAWPVTKIAFLAPPGRPLKCRLLVSVPPGAQAGTYTIHIKTPLRARGPHGLVPRSGGVAVKFKVP